MRVPVSLIISLSTAFALSCNPLDVVASQDAGERGRAVVEAALEALGGRARVAAMPGWDLTGEGRENLSAEVQGLAPDEPTWRPHEERVVVDSEALGVSWYRRTPRNDGSVRDRTLIYRPDASGFVDYIAGMGHLRPAPAPEATRRGFARRVPHWLLLEAATRATELRWTEERALDSAEADVVAVSLPDDVPLDLVIGREPAALHAVEYQRHLPVRGDVTVSYRWHGWQASESLGLAPEGHRIEVDGTIYQEVDYSRFALLDDDGRAQLDVPEDLEPRMSGHGSGTASPEPPLPATGEVAPGVFVENVRGFTVLFVEFRDFVAAVEAPEVHAGLESIPAAEVSGSITAEFLDAIRERVPDKPIRYAVVSHHHSDHLGGIRRFAAAGATLVVAPGDAGAVRDALDRPHTLVRDDWNGDSEAVSIQTVSDEHVITDGTRSLVVVNTGENPHTDENLFVWLPEERILFQGDLFYHRPGTTAPPPGREIMNRFFAELLEERGIEPLAIFGVHNRGAASPELLRFAH